jgi:hypothetical protein
LRSDGRVRDAARGRFSHVLVDEFQDTDPIQAEIVFLPSTVSSASRSGSPLRTWVSVMHGSASPEPNERLANAVRPILEAAECPKFDTVGGDVPCTEHSQSGND